MVGGMWVDKVTFEGIWAGGRFRTLGGRLLVEEMWAGGVVVEGIWASGRLGWLGWWLKECGPTGVLGCRMVVKGMWAGERAGSRAAERSTSAAH